jgi:osmotically-inducible protein OsmY
MRGDKGLQRNVLDKLLAKLSIDADTLGVTSKYGVVTLTVTVSNDKENRSPERAPGVKLVANDIEARLRDAGQANTVIAQAAIGAMK